MTTSTRIWRLICGVLSALNLYGMLVWYNKYTMLLAIGESTTYAKLVLFFCCTGFTIWLMNALGANRK